MGVREVEVEVEVEDAAKLSWARSSTTHAANVAIPGTCLQNVSIKQKTQIIIN